MQQYVLLSQSPTSQHQAGDLHREKCDSDDGKISNRWQTLQDSDFGCQHFRVHSIEDMRRLKLTTPGPDMLVIHMPSFKSCASEKTIALLMVTKWWPDVFCVGVESWLMHTTWPLRRCVARVRAFLQTTRILPRLKTSGIDYGRVTVCPWVTDVDVM